MTYQALPTVATGDMWTADDNNTYIKDNFAALWPYHDVSDMVYATAENSIDWIYWSGYDNQSLFVTSGSPEWKDSTSTKKFCYLRRAASQSIVDTNKVLISFDTVVSDKNSFFSLSTPTSITLSTAGLYRFDGYVRWESNSSGRRITYVYDGTDDVVIDARKPVNGIFSCASFSYVMNVTSSLNTNLRVYQNTGVTINVDFCELMVTYLGAI